ncbi:uncharacterized protein [Montipora capricornis]|uniref:uncharacterized protein n=1 Tax=Montipora capricornis TaxID=246305 RepID=UPI0035F19E0F
MESLYGEVRLTVTGTNLRTEPKHMVFLSQLLLLFKFCHICKTDNPAVVVRQVGTEAVVTTTCSNPKCQGQVHTWHSQPAMPGTGIPAANFLLCMAILLAGGSASKVFQIFSHMGLGCVSLNTFFKYQRQAFPTIYVYWKKYQSKLLEKVKAVSGGVVVAGDGRHDSMGHSAKFGAYTIFCCTVPMIIHFALIQRNQAGSSPAMEFMGFKQCMDYLLGCGVLITTFISDRHTTIASHMKKVLTKIVHYFDIWHLKKKIRKVLTKLSKEKGCEMLSEWIKPCENHLYWSALTTFSGNGLVIWAKFKTFLSHIINKHTSLTDPLFNKCGHGDICPRKWLHAGSVAYEKLCAALTQNSLVRGIKQASPFAQTSCLEGFHSLLNQFAPKMIGYSYDMLRKSIWNLNEIYLESTKKELNAAAMQLKEMAPAPMNSMLHKQPREEAIEKRAMTVEDVAPTSTPISEPITSTEAQKEGASKPRRQYKCPVCKNPMKGHKNVDCPKNRK